MPDPGRKKSLILLLLLFAGVLPLYFLWTCDFLPLADYPNHIARIKILKLYDTSAFYRRYFTVSYFDGGLPIPDLIFDIFAVKLFPFLNEDLAGRIFLSLYVLLSMASVLFLADEAGADRETVLAGYLPLIYSSFFNMAMLNFLFSIPLAILCFGVYLRYERSRKRSYLVLLAALSVLVYLSHLASFFVLAVMLALSALKPKAKGKKMALLIAALFLVPILSYFLYARADMGYYPLGLRYKLHLLPLYFLAYPVNYLDYGMGMAVLLFYALGLLWLLSASAKRNRKFLVPGMLLLFLYLALPFSAASGSLVDARVLPFFFLFMLISAGSGQKSPGFLPVVIFLIVFSIKAYGSLSYYAASSGRFHEIMDCMDRVEAGSVVLPVCSMEGSNINPYVHSWGYEVLKKEIVAPYLFAGRQQPLKFRRPLFAPSVLWGYNSDYREPPGFWENVRKTYDYVILIGGNAGLSRAAGAEGREICRNGAATIYRMNGERAR